MIYEPAKDLWHTSWESLVWTAISKQKWFYNIFYNVHWPLIFLFFFLKDCIRNIKGHLFVRTYMKIGLACLMKNVFSQKCVLYKGKNFRELNKGRSNAFWRYLGLYLQSYGLEWCFMSRRFLCLDMYSHFINRCISQAKVLYHVYNSTTLWSSIL